jgi:hypothetical protein
MILILEFTQAGLPQPIRKVCTVLITPRLRTRLRQIQGCRSCRLPRAADARAVLVFLSRPEIRGAACLLMILAVAERGIVALSTRHFNCMNTARPSAALMNIPPISAHLPPNWPQNLKTPSTRSSPADPVHAKIGFDSSQPCHM